MDHMLSQKAACNSHGQDSSYFQGWEEYEKNPYNELTNPTGIIQMGLAENQVCNCNHVFKTIVLLFTCNKMFTIDVLTVIFGQLSFDLLESWLANNPEPALFKRNGMSVFKELALFQDYHGLPAFKMVSTITAILHI